MRRKITLIIGKILVQIGHMRGGGSSLPGLVVERLYPNFIQTLRPHFQKVVLVTGTNGKTTTTKMLREILHCKYDNIVHNEAGSNMSRGVISAVLSAMDWKGELSADVGLFEVDEGFAPLLAEHLSPDVFVGLNLHRDQLDRYGELERTASMLEEAAKRAKVAVLNIDDSRLRDLASRLPSVVSVAAATSVRQRVPSDDALYKGGDTEAGSFDDADVFIASVTLDGGNRQLADIELNKDRHQVSLQIPGVFNVYNAALALAAAEVFAIDREAGIEALSRVEPAFGRTEQVQIDGKTLQLLLVKNPSGFNQVIASFLDLAPLPTLVAINDNHADGRDVSWLWDVAIEDWEGRDVSIITSGTRGYDMALRLQYAETESSTQLDLAAALEDFLELIPEGGSGYVVPTYTAMLQLRKLIGKKVPLEAWK